MSYGPLFRSLLSRLLSVRSAMIITAHDSDPASGRSGAYPDRTRVETTLTPWKNTAFTAHHGFHYRARFASMAITSPEPQAFASLSIGFLMKAGLRPVAQPPQVTSLSTTKPLA